MPLAFSFFSAKRAPAATPDEAVGKVFPSQEDDYQGVNVSTLPAAKSPFPAREPMDAGLTMPEQQPSQKWESRSYEPTSQFGAHSSAEGIDNDQDNAPTTIMPAATPMQFSGPGMMPFVGESHAQPRGLAALAVHQSEREAPPLNRRPTSPFPSAQAEGQSVAPSSQEATRFPCAAAGMVAVFPSETMAEVTMPRPPSGPLQPEQDAMRQELQQEIEQVKNDLFGAVMGVSALKDRLDGLEAQLGQPQTPVIPQAPATPATSQQEVESWISSWMETQLPAMLERTLMATQAQMLASLSTLAYFRTATPLSGADRQSFLAQPPVILTATPV